MISVRNFIHLTSFNENAIVVNTIHTFEVNGLPSVFFITSPQILFWGESLLYSCESVILWFCDSVIMFVTLWSRKLKKFLTNLKKWQDAWLS